MWESRLSGSVRGRRTTEVYGEDLVAPSRKQAENREDKHFPTASGDSCLLEKIGKQKSSQKSEVRRQLSGGGGLNKADPPSISLTLSKLFGIMSKKYAI